MISTRKISLSLKLARKAMRLFVAELRCGILKIETRELERELEALGRLEARLWLTVAVQASFAPGYLPARFELDSAP